MNAEHQRLLSLNLLPARLNTEQVAALLGFATHDIPTLTARGLLKPLVKRDEKTVKYYAAVELLNLRSDIAWLAKASQSVNDHWKIKNSRRSSAARPIPNTPPHPNASPLPTPRGLHHTGCTSR